MAAASLGSLPSELICEITEHLLGDRAFGSAAALAQCSRRLCGPVLTLLYDNVGRVNLDAGEDGLIWAAENDEVGTLKALLESGVDPNARFGSTLPDCARQDVFAAQRLARRLSPRPDGHLVARLIQAKLVRHQRRRWRYWSQSYNARFRDWYLATINGDVPESPAELVQTVTDMVRAARFGCRRGTPDSEPATSSYAWTALHVVTQRDNTQAVEILLAHGAEIESGCRGLCDCLTPASLDFSAGEAPPTFTALHIAVCSGHQHLARLFLARGANQKEAGQLTSDHGFSHIYTISALHTAALRGDVAMCQILFDHHIASSSRGPGYLLDQKDHQELRAVNYAVAAGHTRTTGSWLLEQGANPLQHLPLGMRPFLSPLNFLCHQGQYRDAQYLLDIIRRRPSSTSSPADSASRPDHPLRPIDYFHSGTPNYTTALQSCFVRLRVPRPPFTATLGSLRHYLDEYMQLVVSEKPPFPERDSEEALVSLVKQLLDLGADPTAVLGPFDRDMESEFSAPGAKSALDLAATRGEREALKVMLDAGADIDSHVSGRIRCTPLGSALLPPRYSPAYEDPRLYLETIIFLLERGASFKTALTHHGPETGVRNLFSPLFGPRTNRTPWYNLDQFDLFERIMELVSKQLGEEHFPAAWAADLLYLSVTCGNQNGNFCRWLVQRYDLAPTDFSTTDLELFSPLKPDHTLGEPGMVEWLLDFMPDTATKLHEPQTGQPEGSPHPALDYTYRGLLPAAAVFVERGLADMPPGAEADDKTAAELEERFRDLIFEACARVIRKGSSKLISAVLDRASNAPLGEQPNLVARQGQLAISRVVGQVCQSDIERRHLSRIRRVLRLLLLQPSPLKPSPLYGVQGRRHGERPAVLPGHSSWDFSQPHPFFYPVPIAVQLGRQDLLKVIFQKTAPPEQDDIVEVLAMALNAGSKELEPAVVQTILEDTPVDVGALIPRFAAGEEESEDGVVTNHVPPLYHLLKTFYDAHVIPWGGTSASAAAFDHPRHDCDCPFVTRDKFLVKCVGLLIQRGASWTQRCLPSGETPLDVLAAILDSEGCSAEWGVWPAHNWATLKRHVKIDWRAGDEAGKALGQGFNPVEVEGLGVKAKWA